MHLDSSPFQNRYPRSTYERLFRKEYGYNNKLHRDDREHAKSRGLVVNSEVPSYTYIYKFLNQAKGTRKIIVTSALVALVLNNYCDIL